MLRLYSTLVIFTLMIVCVYNVENKPGQELKWGVSIVGLIPIFIFLLTI